METVPTKVYEAKVDFVLPTVNEDGSPKGEMSYKAGEKYELPEAVAATAPEGALVEFTPPAPAAEKPAPEVAKPWAGNHKV